MFWGLKVKVQKPDQNDEAGPLGEPFEPTIILKSSL